MAFSISGLLWTNPIAFANLRISTARAGQCYRGKAWTLTALPNEYRLETQPIPDIVRATCLAVFGQYLVSIYEIGLPHALPHR
jgi:hypothetical protein